MCPLFRIPALKADWPLLATESRGRHNTGVAAQKAVTHSALARRVVRARSRDADVRRSSRSTSIVGRHQPRAKSAGLGAGRAGQALTSSAWTGLRQAAQISAAGPAATPG